MNELEGQKAEYAMRCQQLQASLDLQFGSHTHKVIYFSDYIFQQLKSHFFYSEIYFDHLCLIIFLGTTPVHRVK